MRLIGLAVVLTVIVVVALRAAGAPRVPLPGRLVDDLTGKAIEPAWNDYLLT